MQLPSWSCCFSWPLKRGGCWIIIHCIFQFVCIEYWCLNCACGSSQLNPTSLFSCDFAVEVLWHSCKRIWWIHEYSSMHKGMAQCWSGVLIHEEIDSLYFFLVLFIILFCCWVKVQCCFRSLRLGTMGIWNFLLDQSPSESIKKELSHSNR